MSTYHYPTSMSTLYIRAVCSLNDTKVKDTLQKAKHLTITDSNPVVYIIDNRQ